MDRDRFRKVDELLDGALDRPPEERSRFVLERSEGDEELQREVMRLLLLAESDDDFLRPDAAFAVPIFEEVARELERGSGIRQVHVGDKLGPYRLVELLGKGGMGRVYAAEDERLGRRIALKLLPPEAASAERRRRFETEAKAVAALNHPNIVHLYSIEEEDGVFFLTMELVTGATLGEKIPEGGLPLKKFFQMAIPIADALATAHERGVVHRDLKPGNVMIDENGRVKVLDFGLAKLDDDVAPWDDISSTQEGHVLGTASHMSPEQAEGRTIDHRTDIFSLGVILFEMSTGRLPFVGGTPTAVLSSILKDTPPSVNEINPKLPPELSRVIKRCLAKDPERRYQTAVDVRTELEELEYELDSRKLFQPAIERDASSSRMWTIAVVSALVVGGLLFFALGKKENVDIATGAFSQLTNDAGVELNPTLSPDGGFLAYSSRQGADDWDIYLLRAGGQRAINLTEDSPADDVQPAFSPDGTQIAFRSSREDGGLFVMGATGESARRLTTFGWNPAWSPDGKKLVFASEPISLDPFDRPTKSALWTVEVATGELVRLAGGDAVQPSWSPSGHRIAYWGLMEGGGQRDLYTIPAAGGEAEAVTRDEAVDWSPVWSPDGKHLYFSSDRGGSMNLWRVPVDDRSGKTEGPPEPVRAPAAFVAHVSFSRDGRRLVYASSVTTQSLEVYDFDPRAGAVLSPSPLARTVRSFENPRISPDGEWIAGARESPEDIVLVRRDGSDPRLLTDDPHRDRVPQWSPDGSRIAFYSNRSGKYEIWSVKPDGSDLTRLTDLREGPTRFPIWSPDGKRLLFSSPGATGFLIEPDVPWSEQTPEHLPPYPSAKSEFVPRDWSADGKTLVGYLQSRSGVRSGIAAYSFETGAFEDVLDFGTDPIWLPDGRRILFRALGPHRSADRVHFEADVKLFIVDRETKDFRELLALEGASIDSPALSADGRTLAFVRISVDSDIWMLSAVPEEGRAPLAASPR
jgi:Tol biopolymer transport system component